MIDSPETLLPLIDENGHVIGTLSRKEAHSGSRLLHPVVHLHVFNSEGHLYLQQRPLWKDIQPGKWDTAVGGHMDAGESVEEALRREVKEELGITDYQPHLLTHYIFDSQREREMVYVFTAIYNGPITPDPTELADGRFWSIKEITDHIGEGIFTPNFEQEFQQIIFPALRQE